MHTAVRWHVVLWLLIGLVVGSVPTVFALVTDTDASAQNTIEGGTLDLKLSEIGPATRDSTTDETRADVVTDTWEDLSHDETVDPEPVNNTLMLNNSNSSVDADRVNVSVSYTENDTSLGTSGNPDATARTIRILEFTYAGTDLVGTEITDENGNGRVDLEDLTLGDTEQNLTTLSGVAAGNAAALTISFDGDRGLLSLVESGDGLDIGIELRVHAGADDRDTSANNTIRYAIL